MSDDDDLARYDHRDEIKRFVFHPLPSLSVISYICSFIMGPSMNHALHHFHQL